MRSVARNPINIERATHTIDANMGQLIKAIRNINAIITHMVFIIFEVSFMMIDHLSILRSLNHVVVVGVI